MIFVEKNDGTNTNLVHTYMIELQGKDVVYKQAKGSDVIEHFDTEQEAQTRYEELKKDNLID